MSTYYIYKELKETLQDNTRKALQKQQIEKYESEKFQKIFKQMKEASLKGSDHIIFDASSEKFLRSDLEALTDLGFEVMSREKKGIPFKKEQTSFFGCTPVDILISWK